ncbi:MAG: NACHT domain-containing protein [Cyanobacteria bacterium J06638_20]
MGRSRKLTLTDWTSANNALMMRFGGNKSELAKCARKSRTTVNSFFKGEPIGESSFRDVCLALLLNWKQISSTDLTSDPSHEKSSGITQSNEIPIEQVREHCRKKILERHSRMRLLSGEEIEVDQLYVDVWLLEKPERKHFNTKENLLNNFDIAKDRLALGKRIQRNPGFEIANSNPKLIILGKPGSGKTTFLKHLAIDWCKGKFKSEKIAVLIELRQIRELGKTWKLIDTIGQELKLKNEETLGFLKKGKLLVLMDGLDEMPTDKLRRTVQDEVKQVSDEYSNNNRFILTCRTQIMGMIPNGFTAVEVADFNSEQVRHFVQNWFTANGWSEGKAADQWKKIQFAVNNQPDFKELMATPVLLSLICVVLQDSGELSTNRSNLYKKGIHWLLNRWNDEKEIEGWELGTEAYRQLSISDKESLLIEIAARKFENPKNFVLFEQDELVKQIAQKLQLATEQGSVVLKAIETQHGLLIERADELWSFSHLTLQEYFTVQWLTQLPPRQLAKKIVNQQWQAIVEQLIKSQQPADRLLRLIKQAIDQSMTQEHVIQTFLGWLLQKSNSLQSNYKPKAIRAFYYSLTLAIAIIDRNRDLGLALDRDLTRDLARHSNLDLALTRARARKLARARVGNSDVDHDLALVCKLARNLARACDLNLDLNLTRDLDLDLDLACNSDGDLDLDLDRDLALTRALKLTRDLAFTRDLDLDLALALTHAQTLTLSPDLITRLHQLKNKLPTSKEIRRWWPLHGAQWAQQLQQVMIAYRNIGHDWQFTQHQQQLQRYYEANQFLVNLMKIEGAVSEECRTEIEDGLLLPLAELQRRQPHLYGELEA